MWSGKGVCFLTSLDHEKNKHTFEIRVTQVHTFIEKFWPTLPRANRRVLGYLGFIILWQFSWQACRTTQPRKYAQSFLLCDLKCSIVILIYVKESHPISVLYLPLYQTESCCFERSAEMKTKWKTFVMAEDRVCR